VVLLLSPHEKLLIDQLVVIFSSVPEVSRIIVFGSRARGSSNDGSDLDVLVLVGKNDPTLLQTIQLLKEKALDDPEDFAYVNIFALYESNYRKTNDSFLQNVKREGITVWKRK
jgi:predicted nucleotidyltransferase